MSDMNFSTWEPASLPSKQQLNIHVDSKEFLSLLEPNELRNLH